MEHLVYGAEGAFIVGLGLFGYLTAKKGVPWAVAKLKSWWTATETRFATIEADVKALKAKTGL